VIGMSASRINIIVNTLLASFLMEGSISFLNYSYRLMHFPLGVFAVALGTVSLPKASELAAHRDHAGLGRMFSEALTVNLLVILPSAAFLALFAHDIIRLVYQHGAFTDGDTANTTLALLHYSYGLIGFAAVRVTVPFFYALGDSRLPTRISIIAVVLNMVLYLPLIKIMDFAGLAAATSIAGLVNAGLLAAYLPRKGVSVPVGRMVFNSVRILVAAVLAFYTARMLPWPAFPVASESLSAVVALLYRGLAGLLLYVLLCLVLRVEGLRLIIKRNRR